MAKPTRAQIEAQMAELQTQLDTADTDDEIWIKDPKSGHEVKVSGRRATSVLDRFKDLFDDGAGEQGDEGQDDEGGELPPDDQPGDGGYFRGRKK